jgi:hypothetical protein
MELTTAERVVGLFTGRSGVVAVQPVGANPRPKKMKLTAKKYLAKHVKEQKECYGVYLMDEDNKVKCTCVDFDNHDNDPNPKWKVQALETYNHLKKMGLDPMFEISSSGNGAHVWLFFSEPVDAAKARFLWDTVDDKLGIGYKEIYPRQDKLREGGIGNQVRLPYWNESRVIDPNAGPDDVGVDGVELITIKELDDIVDAHGYKERKTPVIEGCEELPESVAKLLAVINSDLSRSWNGTVPNGFKEGTKSNIVYAIARDLVYHRVPTGDIVSAIKIWMLKHSYSKPDSWIELTVDNAYKHLSTREEKKTLDEGSEESTLFSCAEKFITGMGTAHYLASGVAPLDASIDGVGRGEMAIIAARPGHGKSAIALQWLTYQASKGTPVLMLNAEMGEKEIGRRVVMNLMGNDEREWKEQQDAILSQAKEKLGKLPFYFRNISTIEQVEKNMAAYAAKGVQLVAVDYLQLLRTNNKNGRYEAVTEISQRIKTSAREHNVGVLALCQVSREVERRENVHFNGSDLRESGQLEQDADLIMFGWWHARGGYNQDKKKYDIQIAKRRNGPIRTAKVPLRFDAPRQQFRW